jgi:hypothetical protein
MMSMRIDIRRFVTFSLRKFYGRHHDLVNSYGISVLQMTMGMLRLSLSQSNWDKNELHIVFTWKS